MRDRCGWRGFARRVFQVLDVDLSLRSNNNISTSKRTSPITLHDARRWIKIVAMYWASMFHVLQRIRESDLGSSK